MTIKIPLADIDSVNVKSKLFVEFLHIGTNKGELVFSGLAGVDKCKAKITELQSGGEGTDTAAAAAPVEKRKKVVL